MNLGILVWKELWERPAALATSVLAILLGVAGLVGMRHLTIFSEREVTRQLDMLGANVLILPKDASLQNYYSADMNGATLPEQHVSQIMLAGLPGVQKLAPKLCVPAELRGQPITLTGVLPQSEFQAKAAWQSASMFTKKHVGCKKGTCSTEPELLPPESLSTQRTIGELSPDQVVIGADVASKFRAKAGASMELLGKKFQVLAVLPATGTVDDSRVFAHLHTVQHLSNAGEVVSAIEVLSCCDDAAGELVPELASLLPDSKVVTISQVVQTQVGVNGLMARASIIVLVVLVLVGGASVLGTISSSVRERRREIGTLMALGATPSLIARVFLLKALVLGTFGGVAGSALGTCLALWLGPRWAGLNVSPIFSLCAIACAGALLVTLLAAYWPARQAARLDPCICFQEV